MHTLQRRPRLLYVGPEAAAVEREWSEADGADGLAVTGIDPIVDGMERTDTDSEADTDAEADTPPDRVAAVLAEERVDAVACHDVGAFDAAAVVARVRDSAASLPVVVFTSTGEIDAAAATDLGVTTYLQVDADFDAVARLDDLVPLVERHREQRRDLSILDSLLEQVPLSIYVKDRDGRHVRVSDAMPTLTPPSYLENPEGKRHHAPADVEGKTDFDLYPGAFAEETGADDRHVIEDGESIEDRIERAYGDKLEGTYVATAKAPWYDEYGDVVGLVGVTRDITERMQYEHQLERQNERLERFASVISHDLRNPLEVALGRLEFAREDGDEEHFDIVEQSLHRIDALIDDVLTLAREGETVSDPVRTDIAAVAADAWTVVETERATLAVETDANLRADPSRFQQLLENVFRNAVQHAGDDVTVTVGDLEERLGFFVADDGPGIPADDRDDVFEPGYTTGDQGTGLGLSIVRTIAEAHGWDVSVTDAADGGARFEFETLRVFEE
jgi:signal transduction histidine kinase